MILGGPVVAAIQLEGEAEVAIYKDQKVVGSIFGIPF